MSSFVQCFNAKEIGKFVMDDGFYLVSIWYLFSENLLHDIET
jgi:hypothetical protein